MIEPRDVGANKHGQVGGNQAGHTLSAPSPDEPVDGAPPPPPAAADVERILAGVHDPELGVSIVELGMLKAVTVSETGAVTVRIALTTAACPLRGQIKADVASKVRGLPGVAGVEVEYAEMGPAERSELMQRARRHAADHAPPTAVRATTRVIAVASGKGGVGKSSVTVNLAAALAERGLVVGVLDADIWGFSVPRLFGVARRLEARKVSGKGMIVPEQVTVGPGTVRVVSMGLLVDDEDTALMWRGLILAKALEQFLTDVDWGELDYLLVDMPPGTGDIQMALSRLLPQAELLVVTTPAKNAQKVAARVTDMARRSYLKVLGVVENMSAFVTPDGTRHEIFGAGGGERLAALTGAPLLAQIPLEPEVSTAGDDGCPVVIAAPRSPAAEAVPRAGRARGHRVAPTGRNDRLHGPHRRAVRQAPEARPRTTPRRRSRLSPLGGVGVWGPPTPPGASGARSRRRPPRPVSAPDDLGAPLPHAALSSKSSGGWTRSTRASARRTRNDGATSSRSHCPTADWLTPTFSPSAACVMNRARRRARMRCPNV